MSYNKTAKKMMLCSMLFFILSCVHEKDMIESRPEKKHLIRHRPAFTRIPYRQIHHLINRIVIWKT